MEKTWRWTLWIIMLLLLTGSCPAVVMAYFDRGPVKVEAGQPAVTVEEGGSVTVSVNVTPASASQLPGCGMAECPQNCGKGCLNERGDCTCNGWQYQTYNANVQTATSNAGVATVRYSNGVVNIKGIAPGEATIIVTGMLRQYENSSQTIKVTVTAQTSANQPVASTTAAAPNNSTAVPVASPIVKPVQVNADDGTAPASVAAQQNQGTEVHTVMSEHGPILFVPIQQDTLLGKAQLATIMGKPESATFEKKDAAGNVLYSWTFAGKDVTAPADIDLTILISKAGTPELQKLTGGKEALYLDFYHQGPLPGRATVNLSVNHVFANGTKLNLYYYDEKSGQAKLQAANLPVANGYVSISLSHCSHYFLMAGSLASGGGMIWISAIIAVTVLLLLLGILLVIRIKHKQNID